MAEVWELARDMEKCCFCGAVHGRQGTRGISRLTQTGEYQLMHACACGLHQIKVKGKEEVCVCVCVCVCGLVEEDH